MTPSTTATPHVDVHPGDGPPILMVHGMMASRALWTANLDALRAVATPVVLELYGHGRSPSPDDPVAYHPDSYVAAFDRIRVDLGVEQWFLLGHSLGASLTLRYALDHPERVIAHVFSNSASGIGGREVQESMVTNADSLADRILRDGLGRLEESRVNPARSHRIVPAVRNALAADVPLLQPRGVAGTIRYTGPVTNVRHRVAGNRRPTLLAAGTKEESFVEACDFVRDAMPHLTIAPMPAGHSPNAEAPDVFNAAVVPFLADVATS
jgi:2-succinyl-6-hydroxy-2,4-cyclohexadiene-1-carboxylate synthase